MRIRYKLIIFAVIVLAVLTFILFKVSKHALSISSYKITADISHNIRIVHLSDLHCAQFGQDNSRLLNLVKGQKPDLIFLTGDMVNMYDREISVTMSLVTELSKIAPVYCSLGNHEKAHEQNYVTNLSDAYAAAGAIVLERNYADIEIRGEKLRIGGIFGCCYPFPSDSQTDRTDESAYMEDFQNTDRIKLLLCHKPVAWLTRGSLDYWDADVVFSGHAHAGQIRLPIIGGMYAPDQGFFPGREYGLYFSENKENVLVLSRGLGGEIPISRFNNVPEAVVVDLVPVEE